METVERMVKANPLNVPNPAVYYEKAVKDFLIAGFTGMTAANSWDGIDDANGGYIVVKNNGDIVAYHIYNRNAFEKLLFENTKFERGSTGRHEYCSVYEVDNRFFVKLNLAVRFL